MRKDIVDKAREFLGTPFHHQGRLKGIGLDCIGLISEVAGELGMRNEHKANYPRHPDGKTLLAGLKGNVERIEVDDAVPGDILVFWMDNNSKHPQHIGIKTDKGLIHTCQSTGKVVEHCIDEKWAKRIVCAFKFPDGKGD